MRSADGDEVRIVNDAGTITRVKVTIGLIDGEWVEIQEGLKGDELVVVDIASGNVGKAKIAGAICSPEMKSSDGEFKT